MSLCLDLWTNLVQSTLRLWGIPTSDNTVWVGRHTYKRAENPMFNALH